MAPVEFGLFVVPAAEAPDRPLEQVEAAERLGLELIGIQDHPYQRRFLDTWTLISWLAARASRVRLFPDVANAIPLATKFRWQRFTEGSSTRVKAGSQGPANTARVPRCHDGPGHDRPVVAGGETCRVTGA